MDLKYRPSREPGNTIASGLGHGTARALTGLRRRCRKPITPRASLCLARRLPDSSAGHSLLLERSDKSSAFGIIARTPCTGSRLGAAAVTALCALLLGTPASAQTPVTVVVPNAQATADGNGSNGFPFNPRATGTTTIRYQQVYLASEFPAGEYMISAVAFRGEPSTPFSGTTGTLQIDLSTTSAAPDALSTTFADNLGTDTATVFSGNWALSTANNGQFDMVLTFTTPFRYDTSQGNLLLDVRNSGGGTIDVLNNFFVAFDAQSTSGDGTSRVYSGSFNGVGLPTGVVDPGSTGLVTRFTATFVPSAVPGPPTNFQATVSGNTVNMSWGQAASGGAPSAYSVLARSVSGGPVIATLPVGLATSVAVTAPNGTYSVTVQASNGSGSAESSAVGITVPQAVAAPGAPSNLAAFVAGDSVTFTWTAPSTGGPVASYLLVAGTTAGFAVPIATASLPGTPGAAIAGVPSGTYFVRILALNAGGMSGPSNEVSVIIVGPSAPGAPTLNAPMIVGSSVSLSWSAGSGGAPTSYTLVASQTPGGAPLATVPLSGTSVTFTGVPSGIYYLRLTASNALGTSAASNEQVVAVP